MRLLTAVLLLLTIGISLFCSSATQEGDEVAPVEVAIEPEILDLFNGRDLTGWKAFLVEPGVAMEEVWTVRDNLLICKGEPLGYLYTEKEFTNYRLIVEWRWAPETEPGNSGVLLRVNGEPKAIPRSIEAQLKSGSAGDLYGFHGMKIDGAEDRKSSQAGHELLGDFVGLSKLEANENEPGEWNRYEITVDGPSITASVNGKKLNEASGADVLAGPIGLQSEGGEIHFRKVQLERID
jgi:hypothetical protein